MKKFLAIVLALTFVLSFGAISFAAADEVAGTLADGTAVTKPVSEVVKSVEDGLAALDAEKAEALKTFFAEAEAKEDVTVIAKGIVDFAGAFADATEAEIEVPLAAPGVKAGDKVGVSLSTGTSKPVEAAEDDVVTVAFPKDADGVGYVISSAKEKATWDWPLPPEPVKEEEEPTPGKKWDKIYTVDTDYGPVTVYENYDENGNVIEGLAEGTYTYPDGTTETFTSTINVNPDGSSVQTYNSTYTDPNGGSHDYSETITTQADGTSKVETNDDGNTETHYYDANGDEYFPSPEW